MGVAHTVTCTHFPNDGRNRRVAPTAQPWEEVVFYLQVQAASQQHGKPTSVRTRRLHLQLVPIDGLSFGAALALERSAVGTHEIVREHEDKSEEAATTDAK